MFSTQVWCKEFSCHRKFHHNRYLCFSGSKLLINFEGCTVNPGTRDKYCSEHKHLQQPCISSNKISSKSLKILRTSNNQKSTTIGDDTVYIVEGIIATPLGSKYFWVLQFSLVRANPSPQISKLINIFWFRNILS